MSRAQYQKTVKRFYRIVALWSVAFAGATAWLIEVFGGSTGTYGQSIRGHLGELFGGSVGGLTLGASALLVWLGVALMLNRRFGLRCPHCQRSLTVRALPQQVLQTGRCSLCHGRAFDEE